MIPQDFIDDLLARTDIVDLIGQYIPLKKSGANYSARCPFHQEKSPSFSVSPHKQFYHCFGCGAHGSAIGFMMAYQGIGFVDAVEQLAGRCGLSVPRQHGRPADSHDDEQRRLRQQQRQTLETALQRAADFYRHSLSHHPQAQHYLQQRGLRPDTAARYGIGYAPAEWQALATAFTPYPDPSLIENGLVIEKEGKTYDRFRQRIMFPIHDGGGRIIGFGGRVLGDGQPKYLNSPDTPLFHKGKNLYGLHQARQAVRETGRILVVEGYMDVVALAQAGIAYAVATLGTAATADHIKILMRHSDSVYFCFDGDSAGQKAARRALENALPHLQDDKALHFLMLPEGHDPDSYVRQHGAAVFEEQLLHHSRPLSAYFWHSLNADTAHTPESKAELVKTAAPLLKQIRTAPALAYLLQQELAAKTGIAPPDLARLTGQTPPAAPRLQHTAHTEPFRQPRILSLVQKQIRSLLLHPEWAEHATLPDYLPVQDDFACFSALAAFYRQHPQADTAHTLEHFRHSPFFPTLQTVLAHSSDTDTDTADGFRDGTYRLIGQLKHQQINRLKQKNGQLTPAEKNLLLQLLMPRPH